MKKLRGIFGIWFVICIFVVFVLTPVLTPEGTKYLIPEMGKFVDSYLFLIPLFWLLCLVSGLAIVIVAIVLRERAK